MPSKIPGSALGQQQLPPDAVAIKELLEAMARHQSTFLHFVQAFMHPDILLFLNLHKHVHVILDSCNLHFMISFPLLVLQISSHLLTYIAQSTLTGVL